MFCPSIDLCLLISHSPLKTHSNICLLLFLVTACRNKVLSSLLFFSRQHHFSHILDNFLSSQTLSIYSDGCYSSLDHQIISTASKRSLPPHSMLLSLYLTFCSLIIYRILLNFSTFIFWERKFIFQRDKKRVRICEATSFIYI